VQSPRIIAQVEPKTGLEDDTIYIVSATRSRQSTFLQSPVPVRKVWCEYLETKPTAVEAGEQSRWKEWKTADKDGWEQYNTSALQNLAPLREEAARRREESAGESEAAQTSWLSRIFPCLFLG